MASGKSTIHRGSCAEAGAHVVCRESFARGFSPALRQYRIPDRSLRAAKAIHTGIQTRDIAGLGADYFAATFYYDLGGAVPIQTSDRSNPGAGRSYTRNLARQF